MPVPTRDRPLQPEYSPLSRLFHQAQLAMPEALAQPIMPPRYRMGPVVPDIQPIRLASSMASVPSATGHPRPGVGIRQADLVRRRRGD